MLQIDLRELAGGRVEMRAVLGGADPRFEGLEFTLAEPVRVVGRLQVAGEGRFYWRAALRSGMGGGCRRCLAPRAGPVLAGVPPPFSPEPPAPAGSPSSSPARAARPAGPPPPIGRRAPR